MTRKTNTTIGTKNGAGPEASAAPNVLVPEKGAHLNLSDYRCSAILLSAMACLLIGLLPGCTTSSPPTPIATATPTPTSIGGIDPNTVPGADRARKTNARHLADHISNGGVEGDYYLGRFVGVTGIAVRADISDGLGSQVVVLKGIVGTNILCELPGGFRGPREIYEPLPSDGLPVLVAGRVSASRSEGHVVIDDCTVLKTGREVTPRSIAKIPAITNIFQGWGLFWGWAVFAALGYLLAFRRRLVTSPGLLTVFVLSHTGGIVALYAFLGSLVLPYYDTSGTGSLALWPLILALNPN